MAVRRFCGCSLHILVQDNHYYFGTHVGNMSVHVCSLRVYCLCAYVPRCLLPVCVRAYVPTCLRACDYIAAIRKPTHGFLFRDICRLNHYVNEINRIGRAPRDVGVHPAALHSIPSRPLASIADGRRLHIDPRRYS